MQGCNKRSLTRASCRRCDALDQLPCYLLSCCSHHVFRQVVLQSDVLRGCIIYSFCDRWRQHRGIRGGPEISQARQVWRRLLQVQPQGQCAFHIDIQGELERRPRGHAVHRRSVIGTPVTRFDAMRIVMHVVDQCLT